MNNENYNVEDEGVSISQIFGWIKRRWLIFVGLTIIITLLVGIMFQFLIIPSKTTYTVRFSYDNMTDLNKGYYLDGTKFQYRNLISFDSLEDAKEKSTDFKNIDTKNLAISNTLEINEERFYAKPNDATSELLSIEYEITVPAHYFDNRNQAVDYLTTVVNAPVEYNINFLEKLNFYDFDILDNANTYKDQITYLNTVFEGIRNGYKGLYDTFGDVFVYIKNDDFAYESNLLSTIQSNFELKLNQTNYNFLINEFNTYNYIKNYNESKDQIDNYLAILEAKLKEAKANLTSLKESLNGVNANLGDAGSALVKKISDLALEISELEQEQAKLKTIKQSYDNGTAVDGKNYVEDTKVFDANLKAVIEFAKEEAIKYSYIYKNLVVRDSEVIYMFNNVVKTDSTNMVLVILVGLFGGLLVGAVVAGVAGYYDEKREHLNNAKIIK